MIVFQQPAAAMTDYALNEHKTIMFPAYDAQLSKYDTEGRPIQETDAPQGPEPSRFGDWERKGRCIDF